MDRFAQFLKEARRRRMFSAAAVYAVAAWVVIQFANVAFPGWGIPDSAIRYVVYGALLGFPVAPIFGWYYDLTAQGIVRTGPAHPSQKIDLTLHRSDYLIMSAFVLVIGAVTYGLVERVLELPGENEFRMAMRPITEKSIAVLPLENRSPDPENAYFADGVHDDLLTLLSKLGDLKVISRTSVEKFRDTERTIPEIGRELGVAHILEGAVQRVDDQVRITMQLISAEQDEHLWAETYDRDLSAANIFAIQTEIAESIVDSLHATLSPEEQIRLATVPTQNLAALEAYFHGKQRMAKRASGPLAEAVDYFQQAIALDPDFALAWVGLADSYFLQILSPRSHCPSGVGPSASNCSESCRSPALANGPARHVASGSGCRRR